MSAWFQKERGNEPHVEAWMRGPLPGIAPLLMPVAHALTECLYEVRLRVPGATPAELWTQLGGAAAAGFHIRHAAGALDRLFTYARGEMLSTEQLQELATERVPDLEDGAADRLIARFEAQIEQAMSQLRATDESALLDAREVGRDRLPSNVIGLLFHAAEHTQRHMGQFTTTLKIGRGGLEV